MHAEKPRRAKTLTLSLRLDPKTKFIVVVERAIKETADNLTIGGVYDDRGHLEHASTWSDFWDPEEGVLMLKLFSEHDYPTTFDEDELKGFASAHRPFFYTDAHGSQPRRATVEILWPNIDKYLAIWRDKKRTDYWAAGVRHVSRGSIAVDEELQHLVGDPHRQHDEATHRLEAEDHEDRTGRPRAPAWCRARSRARTCARSSR